MSIHLTEKEAYAAMYAYLFKVYEMTKSDDLGGLLGSMSTLPFGETADAAVWEDWMECVNNAKKGKVDTTL
jgi:hypothetical protein